MKKSLLLLFLFCCSIHFASAQQDVLFWFVAPEISQTGGLNLDRPIFMRMTAFTSPATVTISQPAGGGFPTTIVSIPANSTVSLDMTTWIDFIENKPPNTVLNYGIKVQSTAPISAYYHEVSGACLCNPEDFVLKGNNALGTDFWIPGQNLLSNDPAYSPTPHNAFDIVATQNGTTVTITPSHDIVGHLGGTTFTVMLNAGQTYCAEAVSTAAANHLVGSRVTSDKPIAITEKDDLLGYTSGGVYGADLIGDQIVPVPVLGTQYIPMYGNLTVPPGDQLFITATQPATTVTVNGVYATTIVTAGATYQMSAIVPSCYIQTNFPVYVYHLSGIGSEVGSALLPQINCTGSNSVSIQQSSTIDFKLNLLVKTVGIGGFLVNGAAGVITPGMFTTVTATGGVWSSAQVTLPVSSYPIGTVLTVSNPANLFQMGYLSSGPVRSGADFGYFSNYGGINPNPTTTTPNICVGDSIHLYSDTISSATYSWTGPGGFTSTLQNPFVAGSIAGDSGVYKVIVQTPGCEDSGFVTLAVHPYPNVTLGNDTLICGSTSITLQNLDSVYSTDTYLWNTTATTPSIIASVSGTYWLAVTNAVCTKSDTINVNIVPLINPVVTPFNYCQNAPAVPLIATGTGLLWYTAPTGGTGSSVAPIPSTLIPGTYVYYVTSTLGPCESPRVPDTVTIIPLPPPPLITDPTPYCLNQPFIPFTVAGTGVLWYSVPTGGIGSGTAPTVNTTIPGNDTVYASQTVNGCEGPRQSFVVTVLNRISSVFSDVVHYGCKGDTVIFTNSSIGALKYVWSFGDATSDTLTNPVHVYTSQDSFKVKLLAINAQCTDSSFKTIQLIHPLKALFTDTPAIICQDNAVTFTNASTGALTYTWLFGNGATDNNVNTTCTYTRSGIYHVLLVATNFIPCHDTASAIIYVDSATAISLAVTDSVLCKSTYITFTGNYTGIGNTGITWNFSDGDSITNINPVQHAFDGAGTFTVTATPHYRVCRDVSISKTITVFPAPALYLGADTSICPGSEAITIGDYVNATNNKATWKWNTGQTTPRITVVAPGSYYVAVNINGCYTTDTILVQNDCYMDIPNVFTPNGDGLNDYFFPRQYLTKGLTYFKMDIYNRWGQLIFETTNLEGAGWDGRFNNVDQPVGAYVYVIDATFRDGQKEHHQGNVTLLR